MQLQYLCGLPGSILCVEHFYVTVCGVFYCAHHLQWFSISAQWVSLYEVTYHTELTVHIF